MGMTLEDVDRLAVDLGCRRTTRWEAHMKVQALLAGDEAAVRGAIEAAVDLWRGQSSRS